jgi:hypothetical protein
MVPLRPSPYNCNRGSDMCSGTDANMTGNGTTGYVGITPFDLSTEHDWPMVSDRCGEFSAFYYGQSPSA